MCDSHFSQDLNGNNWKRSHDVARLKPLRLGQRYSQVFLFSREDLVDFYSHYKYHRYSLCPKVPKQSQFYASPFASQSALEKRCLTKCLVYTFRSADHHSFHILTGILVLNRYTQMIFFFSTWKRDFYYIRGQI